MTNSFITADRTSYLTMIVLALIVSIIDIIAVVSIQSINISGIRRSDASPAAIDVQKQRNAIPAVDVSAIDVGLDGMYDRLRDQRFHAGR